jgi:hypothetical protein
MSTLDRVHTATDFLFLKWNHFIDSVPTWISATFGDRGSARFINIQFYPEAAGRNVLRPFSIARVFIDKLPNAELGFVGLIEMPSPI